MADRIDGTALAAMAAGSLFAYAGIKGISVLKSVQNIIRGGAPGSGQQTAQDYNPASGGIYPTPSGAAPGNLGEASYSPAQLQALWVQAGGNPAAASNAACHAMQESSGDPRATSPNPDGGTNVGLWQLDTNGKGAGYSIAQLMDPVTNARLTVMGTANGTDWSAWATPGC